jgi:membrane protein DedA with SNARE-associated domain
MLPARTRSVLDRNVAPGRIGIIAALGVLASITGLGVVGVDLGSTSTTATAGYVGVFIAGVIASVTLLLPVPMLGMVFVAAALLNPILLGVAAAAGISAGLWPTYFAGTASASAIGRIERSRNAWVRAVTERSLGWFRTRPIWATFLLALVPNPIFDFAGVMAGAFRVPFWQFLASSFAGKLIQFTSVALLGYFAADYVPFLG